MADRAVTVIPAWKTFARASDTNVLRVAAYARASTDSDEQMGSVAAQKDYFEKLIQKRPDWVLVDIYADEGISGTFHYLQRHYVALCQSPHSKFRLFNSIPIRRAADCNFPQNNAFPVGDKPWHSPGMRDSIKGREQHTHSL
jgi:hypothetical protein